MTLIDPMRAYPPAVAFDQRGAGAIAVQSDSARVTLLNSAGVETDLPVSSFASAGVVTSLDRRRLDRLHDGGMSVDAATDIAGITVDADVMVIEAAGHAEPGDGGWARYRRTATEPAHAGKVQSADGAWWGLQPGPEGFNLLAFGVDPTGTTDSSAALQAAFDAAVSARQNVICVKCEIRAENVALISGDTENLTIDLNGSTIRQITPGSNVLVAAGRDFELRNIRFDSHDDAESDDILFGQGSTFYCRFVNITLGTRGAAGRWLLGSNGHGGIYWNSYEKCHAAWLIDPTVSGLFGPFNSSVNANSWRDSIVEGVEVIGPTITPGAAQQFYGNNWIGCDIVGPIVNNYTHSIGPGTGDDYEPAFYACTYEHDSDPVGPIRFEARRVASFSDRLPFDPDYTDRRLRIDSSVSPNHGDYEPEASEVICRADPAEGRVPLCLSSDFNGTWSAIFDPAEKAPCGDTVFHWTKDASGQGSPAIHVPASAVRRAAHVGGLTVSVWCRAVTGTIGPISGFRKPASAPSVSPSASATMAGPGDGWVLRWSTIRIERSHADSEDDLLVLMSDINLNVAAEFLFGTIEIRLGRTARPPVGLPATQRATAFTAPADGATWTPVFTIATPERGTAAYKVLARVTQTSGRATASVLASDILVARYDGTVVTSASPPQIATTATDGALDGVRARVSGTDVIVEVRLSAWWQAPVFSLEATIKAMEHPETLARTALA